MDLEGNCVKISYADYMTCMGMGTYSISLVRRRPTSFLKTTLDFFCWICHSQVLIRIKGGLIVELDLHAHPDLKGIRQI